MTTLNDNEYLVYHYSSVIFDTFEKSKSDGFWFTDIKPSDTDLLEEIGAAGSSFVAKCIITINNEIDDFDNFDCFEQLIDGGCDGAECKYDGFNDYCVLDDNQINILEWVKL